MKPKQSVVFFGTGPVAAQSLELLSKNFIIEAVITKPKPSHHRGTFPVVDIALQRSLPLQYVTDKQSVSQLMKQHHFKSKVGVLIDFGIIVGPDVISSFEKGIVNSHFSLLPEWRGADPITFSILSGQEKTGVSLMLLVQKMDEGPLLDQSIVTIANNDTASSLTRKLITASDMLLQKTLASYTQGDVLPEDQTVATLLDQKTPTYSSKIAKSDGVIDWSKPASRIEREIRAYLGWPQSKTTLGSVDCIITKAHVEKDTSSKRYTPGTFFKSDNCQTLAVGTSQGILVIEEIKPLGKKSMSIQSFLAGYGSRL
jgi:methionyl-tRNA formyltransferase